MSDKFGRHQSTRWVRASVPTYGDDWNDDYEYGSASDEEAEVHYDTSNIKPERFVLPETTRDHDTAQEHGHDAKHEAAPPNEQLVLSIDGLNEADSDSHSEHSQVDQVTKPPGLQNEEATASNSSFDFNSTLKEQLEDSQAAPLKTTVVKAVEEQQLQPPTPVYNVETKVPDTPASERSFISDADSIQNETDLRVTRNVAHNAFGDENIISEVSHKEEEPQEDSSNTEAENAQGQLASTAGNLDPLVLSIDRKSYSDINSNVSESDSDGPVPYYEKTTAHPNYDFDSDEEADESHDTDRKSHNKTNEALDDLIHDLQSASMNEEGKEMLPTLDSIQDFKLPDFNNSYDYYNYEDEDNDSNPVTPTVPLSSKDEKAFHEKYVSQLTSHKPSVRKPPSAVPANDNNNWTSSVKKQETEIEDSPTYSNFGDPVDMYLSDHENENVVKEFQGKEVESHEPQGETFNEELHPVASSGSLSTGKLSVDTVSQQQDNSGVHNSRDLNRRDSTMSTNTLNMGAWKPNTNNFRDQFINDNDNESQINFNMYSNDNAGYSKFTKRAVSDAASSRSSLSIPDTIDVALPSIDEDPADENGDTFNSIESPKEHPLSKITSGTESHISGASLSRQTTGQQRYTSLLDPDDSTSRVVSQGTTSSAATTETEKALHSYTPATSTSTKKTYVPAAYPVSNWKTIMKPSQSVDRIALLKEALQKEIEYETGLQNWLHETLKKSDNTYNMHIGKIATQAYQNAPHNDLRRHTSIRSRVSSVKDKVETSGISASNLGKRFFNRGKKLMKSGLE